MIPMTHPDIKIMVSPMVEMLRVKIPLGTLWVVKLQREEKVSAPLLFYGCKMAFFQLGVAEGKSGVTPMNFLNPYIAWLDL